MGVGADCGRPGTVGRPDAQPPGLIARDEGVAEERDGADRGALCAQRAPLDPRAGLDQPHPVGAQADGQDRGVGVHRQRVRCRTECRQARHHGRAGRFQTIGSQGETCSDQCRPGVGGRGRIGQGLQRRHGGPLGVGEGIGSRSRRLPHRSGVRRGDRLRIAVGTDQFRARRRRADQRQRGDRAQADDHAPAACQFSLGGPTLGVGLGQRDRFGLGEEHRDLVRDVATLTFAPVDGRGQGHAVQQQVAPASGAFPLHGRPLHVPTDPQFLTALDEPARQTRPRGQDRVVREAHPVDVQGQQSRRDEAGHQIPLRPRQIRPLHGPRGVRRAVARLHHAQHEASHVGLLRGLQRAPEFLRCDLHCAGDAAGGLVVGHGQRVPGAPRPGPGQRVGEQRQPRRVVPGVGEHALGQAVGQGQADLRRRTFDDLTQRDAAHRLDQQLVGVRRGRDPRVRGARGVEVGADRQHDPGPRLRADGQRDQHIEERRALLRIGAEGEQLLELVHDENQGARGDLEHRGRFGTQCRRGQAGRSRGVQRGGERAQRPLTRRQQTRRGDLLARAHGCAQPRQQSGADQGGLAAARSPGDDEHGVLGEPGDQGVDFRAASEEQAGVLRLQRGQTLVRLGRPGGSVVPRRGCLLGVRAQHVAGGPRPGGHVRET